MRATAFGPLAFAASVASTAFAAAAPAPSPAPAAPCGFVTFLPVAAPRVTAGTMAERIRVTVTFSDGHTESATFPYPWVYPNGEQTDPWSYTNLKNPSLAVALQPPPPGNDVKALPPIIAYVIAHTNSAGMTNLVDCPPRAPRNAPGGQYQPIAAAPELLRFVDESAADSPVAILEATLSSVGAPEHLLPGVVQQCVTYKNRASQTVTKLSIAFTYRNDHDKLLTTQTLTRAEALAPGAVVHGIRRDAGSLSDGISRASNCRLFAWGDGISTLKVSVTSVTFADGSTWTTR